MRKTTVNLLLVYSRFALLTPASSDCFGVRRTVYLATIHTLQTTDDRRTDTTLYSVRANVSRPTVV